MAKLTAWKAGVIALTFVAWPLVATAEIGQQSGGTTQPGSQGFGQGQAENVRQIALGHLTAARQDLADVTKLPAAAHIQGQARSDLNELISNFNALITSNGPDWRQAYDRVQSSLTALVGPEAEPSGQSAVGTSGTAPPSLDPTIMAKLSDMRQHIEQFGETVGVKPGQPAAGTSGTAPNEQVLRNIDQIGAIVSRALSQAPPDQATVSVTRLDLQQIQDYLTQLRQSLAQAPIR